MHDTNNGAADAVVRLVAVTQHYGVRPVLENVDLEIQPGRLTAVVGPNGMGKTTLLAVMAGVLSPQHGRVEIGGLVRRANAEDELNIRRRVVYLPDHPWLPVYRTGREFVIGVGRVYGIDIGRLLHHADQLLTLFELQRQGDWPIRSYSNGQKKKIALCATLITEAPILLLDEPFGGGLDPAGILALKRVLQTLGRRPDRTVVLTAPVAELVDEIGQRIIVLRDGRVAADGSPDELRRQTGSQSLADVLGHLVHPSTVDNVRAYLEGLQS